MSVEKKIILYTGDYFCKDIKRRREIRQVINNNLQLPFKHIVILYENWSQLSEDIKKQEYKHLENPKITVVDWKERQSYKDFYLHSHDNYPNDIIVISNSDIMFDKTISRLHELDYNSKKLYALSRYENNDAKNPHIYKFPVNIGINICWSFDVYIFTHPITILPDSIDIYHGTPSCDSYLVKKLIYDNLIKVENPCLDIRCWHYDYREVEKVKKDYAKMFNYNNCQDSTVNCANLNNGIVKFNRNQGLCCKYTYGKTMISEKNIFNRQLKVISFSLWGDEPKYIEGAILNAEIALDKYPDWHCIFYIHKDVSVQLIEKLKKYPNVIIIFFENINKGMIMRFFAIDLPYVDTMICRDCDSLLSDREVFAVKDWLSSGKSLHIIRDHPFHCGGDHRYRIFGGMFGMRKVNYWPGWDVILNGEKIPSGWGYDLEVLQKYVYPLFSVYDDIFIHASFNDIESYSQNMPTKFNPDYNFVGEYNNLSGIRNIEHIEILKKSLENPNNFKYKKINLDICLIVSDIENLNLKLFPFCVKFWKTICNIKAILFLIGEKIPDYLQDYKDNIFLLGKIPEKIVKQTKLLSVFCTCLLNESSGIIISNLNTLPCRGDLFSRLTKRFDQDRFVYFQDESNNFMFNFCLATPNVWREIFEISSDRQKNFEKISFISHFNQNQTEEEIILNKIKSWGSGKGLGRTLCLPSHYTNLNPYEVKDFKPENINYNISHMVCDYTENLEKKLDSFDLPVFK
jgi:hypothetical protein